MKGTPYNNMTEAFLGILKKHGFTALYAGLDSEFVKVAAQGFCYSYFHTALKVMYRKYRDSLQKQSPPVGGVKVEYYPEDSDEKETPVVKPIPVGHALLIGIAAGVLTRPIMNPLNVIQTRLVTGERERGIHMW